MTVLEEIERRRRNREANKAPLSNLADEVATAKSVVTRDLRGMDYRLLDSVTFEVTVRTRKIIIAIRTTSISVSRKPYTDPACASAGSDIIESFPVRIDIGYADEPADFTATHGTFCKLFVRFLEYRGLA